VMEHNLVYIENCLVLKRIWLNIIFKNK